MREAALSKFGHLSSGLVNIRRKRDITPTSDELATLFIEGFFPITKEANEEISSCLIKDKSYNWMFLASELKKLLDSPDNLSNSFVKYNDETPKFILIKVPIIYSSSTLFEVSWRLFAFVFNDLVLSTDSELSRLISIHHDLLHEEA